MIKTITFYFKTIDLVIFKKNFISKASRIKKNVYICTRFSSERHAGRCEESIAINCPFTGIRQFL